MTSRRHNEREEKKKGGGARKMPGVVVVVVVVQGTPALNVTRTVRLLSPCDRAGTLQKPRMAWLGRTARLLPPLPDSCHQTIKPPARIKLSLVSRCDELGVHTRITVEPIIHRTVS